MTAVTEIWPHKQHILVNPAKRKSLAIFALAVSTVLVLTVKGEDITSYFVKSHDRDALLPQMAILAGAGKPDAVVWMMVNDATFRDADPQYTALRKTAEAGHPPSMFYYAKVLKFKKDEAGAKAFMARAAADGYPAAVLDQTN